MDNQNSKSTTAEFEDDSSTPNRLAIEGKLPLKAVGIENLKEGNPKHMPPHRYIHPWFARRPTPAARLAVLASVMPDDTDANDLLSLMQIGPKEHIDTSIAKYVESKKTSEDGRDGTLGDHYGYPRPFTQSPSKDQLNDFHDKLRKTWDGDLPTVLDATAGGGVIPLESLRYGLPTRANELNPIPSLLLKVLLEYAPSVGSLGDDLRKWRDQIMETASENLKEYYPASQDNRRPLESACTYSISCDSCGGTIPLAPKWWLYKQGSSKGVAIRPQYDDGDVEYESVRLPDDVTKSEFDPNNGTVSRGDAECPHCAVVTKSEDIQQKFKNNDFEYEVYGVKYEKVGGGSGYRAGTDIDQQAIKKAAERVESDFDLLTLLSTPIPDGQKTREPKTYGMTEWRDMFNPRQLVAHYEYLNAFRTHAEDIRAEYDDESAEALLTILALTASKLVDYNSRLSSWNAQRGYPNQVFKGNNLAFRRMFVDNNLSAANMGYEAHSRKIIDCYEEICEYVAGRGTGDLNIGDAANLPDRWADDSTQAVVVDPPYYNSIMYAELSDVFYVWQKEYLGDVHPDLFAEELTNKDDEAVANASKFEGIAGANESKRQLAKEDYERKMSDIFEELYRVLEPGGVLTVMFTHKETDAWDTLTMSLINAGFTVTATHPITSEIPTREGMMNSNSADSTILLAGRKPTDTGMDDSEEIPSLWSDVRMETRTAAKDAARDLLDSGLSLTKTDIIIAAFGPTLRVYADNYPVVDNKDDPVPPREALTEARDAVTKVLSNQYLATDAFDDLDELTRWYVLSWLVYDSDTFPYDEGRQLGVGVGVDVDDVKRSTKIWGKSSGDIQLKDHTDRVQDITKLEADENVSSRKYPVDPRRQDFTYTIDAVHAAFHVYEKKGADAAWEWLTERGYQSNQRFKAALTSLLKVLPENHSSAETGRDLISGKTGDLLGIDASDIHQNTEKDENKKLTDNWS